MTQRIKPHLIAIGGLDPTGGAGILRDALTAQSLAASFRLVGTSWAEQSAAAGVQSLEARPLAQVRRALQWALEAAPAGRTAVKLGVVVDEPMVRALAGSLAGFEGPIVFDPVLGASAGGQLFDRGDASLMESLLPLMQRATVITPNAVEASQLWGRPLRHLADAEVCATQLLRAGARNVVIKGGHLGTTGIVDVLVTPATTHKLERARVPGPSARGTGCTYASALALTLLDEPDLASACAAAQALVAEGLQRAELVGGQWHLGPVNA